MGTLMEGLWNVPASISESNRDNYTAEGLTSELFLLLLLSHFSRVRLCATPQMAAHQVPPSLGFSRQEHWSGLPFPSPMHESEKWKWSCSVVSNPQRPHVLQPSRLLRPWDFPDKSTGVGCHCLLRATWLVATRLDCTVQSSSTDSLKPWRVFSFKLCRQ